MDQLTPLYVKQMEKKIVQKLDRIIQLLEKSPPIIIISENEEAASKLPRRVKVGKTPKVKL